MGLIYSLSVNSIYQMSFNWRRFHTDWLVTRTFRSVGRGGGGNLPTVRLASIDEPEINKKIMIWLVVSNMFYFPFHIPSGND